MGKKNYSALIVIFSIILYFPLISAETTFIRGDANSDSKVDISDQTFIFNYLYLSGEPPKCEDAADVDDNGKIEMTDGVYLRDYLFLGSGKPPAAPYPNAGIDTTNDDLSCEERVGQGGAGSVTLSMDSSTCSGEYSIARVKGYVNIPFSHQAICVAFGSDDYWIGVELYEDDAAGDDYITSKVVSSLKSSDCVKVEFDFEIKSERLNLGQYIGGLDGDTAEVYAETSLGEQGSSDVLATASDSNTVNVDVLSTCQCFPENVEGKGLPKGPCCTTTRPYKFKSNNAQPENQQDIYTCTESNNPPVQNDQIKLLDYYCNGKDAKAYGPTSNVVANCGVCSYCIQGRNNCFVHDGKEACGTTDCDNKDTNCRNYHDRASACIQGTCTELFCTVFDNAPQGTSCNNGNGRCDGGGACSNCQDTNNVICNNNDEYYTKECGAIVEPRQLKKDCEENSCSDVWTYYCEGDNLMKKQVCYNKGCSNNQCYSEREEEKYFVKKCEWGCLGSQCKPNPNIKCSNNNDCPRKYGGSYCYNVPGTSNYYVYNDYNDYECANPGTQSAYCKEINSGKVVEDKCECGCSNSACISPCPTCSDNTKNGDETDIDCGGSCSNQGKKCANTKSCKIGADCQTNYCNPSTLKCENAPPCTNECSVQGSTRCSSSSIQQTCGNYDADACLEWGGSITCSGGCSNNQCNLPDLTVLSFIMQYPRTTTAKVGETISMAFTIKNEGVAPANGIFWKLEEPGHFTRTNTNGISLLPGSSTAVFILTSYSSAGTYSSKLTIDPNNNIKETNEDNNQKTLTITVV